MAAEPIRSKKELARFINFYYQRKSWRNYALIVMGINTALRISDLLSLRWADVYDFEGKRFRARLELTEGKTGKEKSIALNKAIVAALRHYLPHRRGDFIFANNRADARPISRIQAHRVIKAAVRGIREAARVSCHSMRKTFGYHAWNAGVKIVLLMDIYNHSSYSVTRRYLGICQDDRDAVYLKMALM
jgi:integrase